MLSPADRYEQLRAQACVQERSLFVAPREASELELQARWFAGDFGRHFRSVDNQSVEIVQFGTWNREAGPDFHGAAIRVGDGAVQRGSIEFDLTDRSWETHGHALNPAFEDTVLHVFVRTGDSTFFSRTRAHRNVPQVRVDPAALPENLAAQVPLAQPGRCQAPLRDLPVPRVATVLEAAAQYRLRRKASRLRRMIESHGADEVLFQELAAALGYKQNKLPFTLLAQRLPLGTWRDSPASAEAILFGLAGFLEAPDLSVFPDAARAYVRGLWDNWWPHRDGYQRLVLPRALWQLSGARPLNHPQRRLAALAQIAAQWPAFRQCFEQRPPAAALRKFLLGLRHPFWDHHYTLASAPAAQEMALVGDSRVAEILANVGFPFLLAQGVEVWEDYARLPARLSNRRLETAATRLFGGKPLGQRFLRQVAQQQGLLQIYEDFCLQDNSDCQNCPFPEQMRKWV